MLGSPPTRYQDYYMFAGNPNRNLHLPLLLMKVKAHQKIMPFHGVLDKWTISGNNTVDEAAKAAVRSHPSFRTLATDYKARKQYKQHYCNYVRCLCDLAEETFSILSQKQAKHSFQASQQAPTDFNMWLVEGSLNRNFRQYGELKSR